MNAEETELDNTLRTIARRNLEHQQRYVDADLELVAFNARLSDDEPMVRVEQSAVSPSRANRKWWIAAAAAGVAALVGTAVLSLSGDGDRRIGSPATTPSTLASPPSSTSPSTSSPDNGSDVRDTTPRATPQSGAFSVDGGFNILQYPKVGFADSKAELAELLADAQPPIDVDELGVDWDRYGVVLFVRPTDLCPSVFGGAAINGDVLSPVFLNPGYQGCEEPLLSHTVIAAVPRDVLVTVERVELPPEAPYFTAAISVPVKATPASGSPATTTGPDAPFGALRGSAPLPDVGVAVLATMDDGSPVVLIRHHDNTISAIQPWASSSEPDGSPVLVSWIGATRTFLGNGAWDEYGRRLDGPRDTDLETYATRIVGNLVEIGSPVATPSGGPIGSTTSPRTDDLTIRPDNAISLTDALALHTGQTRWISTSLVIDPTGAHLCDASGFTGSPELDPCPNDAPQVEGIDATPDMRTVRYGPLLATRTDAGFTNIVPTGGYASSSYGDGLPPLVTP